MNPEPKPSDHSPQSVGQIQDREDRREARREFLAKCGRFAIVTPPAVTMLLAMSTLPREAHAVSGNSSELDEIEQRGPGVIDLIDRLLS